MLRVFNIDSHWVGVQWYCSICVAAVADTNFKLRFDLILMSEYFNASYAVPSRINSAIGPCRT